MTETQPSKEIHKPDPLSVREYYLMDRHQQKDFMGKLTKEERRDFHYAAVVAVQELPKNERRALAHELVAKLERRENDSLGDKIELFLAKKEVVRLSIPEKQPIFLRKLRSKEFPWPKWIKEKRSPYLIGAH